LQLVSLEYERSEAIEQELNQHLRRSLMRAVLLALTVAAFWGGTGTASAEVNWPTKTIRAIVPFTAGSASDIIPRTVFEQLSRELGQSIVVENRSGAGGTIGAAAVARSEPDGYTILANSSSHTIVPSLYPNTPYDPVRDFAGVIPLGSMPNVLVVAPSKGYNSLQDLVAAAKAKPGSIVYASAGVGSATHFSAERFRLSAGFAGVHVPFRGSPEAFTEAMAGRVDFYFGSLTPALPFIREGKLLALAVSTPKRASALPDAPTTLEEGLAGSDSTFWIGMFAPARTPRAIIEKLHRATLKVLLANSMQEKLAKLGVDPMVMTSSEFDEFVRAEIATNGVVVKTANMSVTGNR
jgi:tripartite-type tricarboxylate transporter receptor subunit TctC